MGSAEPYSEKGRSGSGILVAPVQRKNGGRLRILVPSILLLASIWAVCSHTQSWQDVFPGPWRSSPPNAPGRNERPPGAFANLTKWEDIPPSEKLVWHECFGLPESRLRCARLTVPMDYHRPLNESATHPKVHIAIAMIPGAWRNASVSSYGESPLLINPGGPGGSGTQFAMMSGPMLQGVVGDHHDIIGFDPRGIGATTPKADCFASADRPWDVKGANNGLINRLTWMLAGHDVGVVNSSNVALSKIDVRSRAVGQLCKRTDEVLGDASIFRYSNTPNVARDMLSIVHAWDEWKASAPEQDSDATSESRSEEPEPAAESTKGKLVYWGFSYGTLLGATFASMFPENVGRIILDGVVDADHYVGPTWKDSLIDADAILDEFLTNCLEAGTNCALYRNGDKFQDIKTRYETTFTSLEEDPIVLLSIYTNQPFVLTASDMKSVVFAMLYSPVAISPIIATILNDVHERSWKVNQYLGSPEVSQMCSVDLSLPGPLDDGQKVVMCSDKRYKLNATVPELQKLFEEMGSYSSFADVWMTLMLQCNDWQIEARDPPMRWDDHPITKPDPIKTSFPLLLLSTHYDPVCPLYAALKMTRKFENASIVEQKSSGHCTLSCASLCTINHVRAYLNEGVLPQAPKFDSPNTGEWPTCECNEKPWKPFQTFQSKASLLKHKAHSWDEMFSIDQDIAYGKSEEEISTLKHLSGLRSAVLTQAMKGLVGQHHPLRRVMGTAAEYFHPEQ